MSSVDKRVVGVTSFRMFELGLGAMALMFGIVPGQSDGGRAVLERALEALGGRARIEAVSTWDVEGRGRENLSAEAQGLSPGEPTWRSHQERLGVDRRTLSVAWQRRTPRNDMSLRYRRFIYREDASGFVDFVAGVGRMRPGAVPESRRRGYARRVIEDGERSLIIFNTGPNPHTDENLFVWLPAERIVFQGDLFYYVEGMPHAPAGRETMNRFFQRHLRERGLEPRAVYGVHNRGAAAGALLQPSAPGKE